MQHRNIDLGVKLSELRTRVKDCDNLIVRRDLAIMLDRAERLWTELDSELVVCRQKHRYTTTYNTVESKLAAQLETVSKWLVWAHLSF